MERHARGLDLVWANYRTDATAIPHPEGENSANVEVVHSGALISDWG
jgi:hypothetical protein